MRKFLILLMLSLQVRAEYLPYDADRRVPWANDAAYETDDYSWWMKSTGEPSRLWLNGIYQSQEPGTNDIGILDALEIQSTGVKIGVVDVNNLHGNRVKETARLVADAEAELSNSLRLYPDDVASAVSNFVSTGYRIIVVTTGTSPHTGVSNALRYAESSNALVFCAVPNAEVNIDVTPDYPSSWAHEISSIIPVTNTDRNGNLYNPGASAYGTNTLGAPGRRIVCDPGTGLVQWSGTSAATPMAAGVGSLLIKRFASQTSAAYRQALMASAHTITGTRRIDSIRALTIQEPHLSVNGNTLTVHGLTEWRYGLERSGDLQTWTVYTNVMGGQTMTVTPAGFYRAAVK